MSWEEYYTTLHKYIAKIKANSEIDISHFAILKFGGMRNFAGKLQYYTM
jgi:hypothetical protein